MLDSRLTIVKFKSIQINELQRRGISKVGMRLPRLMLDMLTGKEPTEISLATLLKASLTIKIRITTKIIRACVKSSPKFFFF